MTLPPKIDAEARDITRRNVTANIAGARLAFEAGTGHARLVYYVFATPTDDDEEWRELAMGELIAALPEIRTASTEFRGHQRMTQDGDGAVVFERD